MKFEKKNLFWIREADRSDVTDDRITIYTQPKTDLWQRTYYGFQNDSAPVLQMKTSEKYFSFIVKTEFDSKARFDQCGIVVYLDSENWIKASIEYENEQYQRLGSVVTNRGYSDWATTDIDASVKSMWYRLSRRDQTIVLSAAQMLPHSGRCVYAICGKGTGKFLLAFMPAVRKRVLSRRNLRICRLQNVCGKPIDSGGVHD